MIHSIFLDSFRGIRFCSLDDFRPLTILTGPNGSGKTSLLEAMFIGASEAPGEALGTVVAQRRAWFGAKYLVTSGRTEALVEVFLAPKGTPQWSPRLALKVEAPVPPSQRDSLLDSGAPPPFLAIVIRDVHASKRLAVAFAADNRWVLEESSVVERDNGLGSCRYVVPGTLSATGESLNAVFSRAVRQGRRQGAIELLRELVPGVVDLELLVEADNRPVLNLVFENGAIPVTLAGDGIREMVRLIFELGALESGTVLLEEPETFLHPAAMRAVARAIVLSVRRGVQVIMATHSLEFIDALIAEADDPDLAQTCLFNLRLDDGHLKSGRSDGDEIRFARNEIEADLR